MLLLRSIKQKLQTSGFDLCHPIHTAWYNQMIQNEGLVEKGALQLLPEPSPSIVQSDEEPSYNAVLIGNTKVVWPSFIDWLAVKVKEKKRQQDIVCVGSAATHHRHETAVEDVIHSNPFDTYCEESLSRSLQELCCRGDESKKITSYELFWSNGKRQKFFTNSTERHEHDTDVSINNQYHCFDNKQSSFLVSMQRIASASGQYWHDEENTKLCVHPVFGTWMAFRALVIFETEHSYLNDTSNRSSSGGRSNTVSLPSPCPCPLSEEEMKEAKKIFDYALEMNTVSGQSSNNIGSYGTQANKTWDELCTFLHNQVCKGSDWDEVPESMKPWIELRNAISVGRSDWKYDEAQLLYHYTKDPNILRRELERIKCRNIEQNE
mmetsp:Transcript_15677/g.25769  ORF Transcript_15677/g.25769 Transcript_15677/m.25769 type:complete len:378 (+) Transcript_15677:118-1251(+)